MSHQWDEVQRQALRDREQLERIKDDVSCRLEDACRSMNIRFHIESRVKEPESILEKLVRMPTLTYDKLQDKVGVRILPTRKCDLELVATAVRETFTVMTEKDTLSILNPSTFGYRGHHFVIQTDGELCEVQVRTQAQDLWAAASHELAYKRAKDSSRDRSLARIAAVLEIVDEELDRLREKQTDVTSDDRLHQLKAIALRDHWRLGGGRPRQCITDDVIKHLRPLLSDVQADELEQFIKNNEQILRKKISDYSGSHPIILLTQPESLLVHFLIQEDRLRENTWPDGLPTSWFDAVRDAWPPP